MLVFAVLSVLVVYNLFNVVIEENHSFYKDIRFWLVMVSLGVLIWLAFAAANQA